MKKIKCISCGKEFSYMEPDRMILPHEPKKRFKYLHRRDYCSECMKKKLEGINFSIQ